MNPMNVAVVVGAVVSAIMAYIWYAKPIEQHRHRSKDVNDYVPDPDSICPICLEEIGLTHVRYLPCAHSLHQRCWADLHRNNYSRCPICQMKF